MICRNQKLTMLFIASFFGKILGFGEDTGKMGFVRCVPYPVMFLEVGFIRLKMLAWLSLLKFLGMFFNSAPFGLMYQLLTDPGLLRGLWIYSQGSGLDTANLHKTDLNEAHRIFKERMLNAE